jgi:hypothetical protein
MTDETVAQADSTMAPKESPDPSVQLAAIEHMLMELDVKVDRLERSAVRARHYAAIRLIFTIVFLLAPLVGLFVFLPKLLGSFSGGSMLDAGAIQEQFRMLQDLKSAL